MYKKDQISTSCWNLRNILSAIIIGILIGAGAPAIAVDLTVEGTSVADPKVRGFERLDMTSTSGGPIVIQTSTLGLFGVPTVNTIVSDLGGSFPFPALNDVGLVFVGTLSESGGTVYQYFFNKNTFCAAAGSGPFQILFTGTVNSALQSTEKSWIAC